MSANADPNFLSDTTALTGPIFGMKSDFNGVGVLFDTYDNDGQRNNPSIFVVQNEQGDFRHSHDADFEHDMVKTLPRNKVPGNYEAYRCVADIRNLGRPVKAVVKVLNGVLSVYLDTDDGQGWRFCLAVEFERRAGPKRKNTLKDTHIAFTAATGQVADHMDIHEVTTRYLKSTDVGTFKNTLDYKLAILYTSFNDPSMSHIPCGLCYILCSYPLQPICLSVPYVLA